MKYIPKLQNAWTTIQRDVVRQYTPNEKVAPIPLTLEQQQNFKLYGSLNKPEVKQTYLNQGKKLTPAEQTASNKKLAEQGKLQAYKKQQEQDAKNLEKAAEVAPYVIPGMGQMMWAGKAVDLAVNGASNGKYKSWGNAASQITGDPEWIGDLTNPGYYAGAVSKLATPLIKKSIQRIPINYSNYNNLRSIEVPRFKSLISSLNDEKALQTAANQFTNRNTFYRGVKNAESLDEAAQMLTTVDGKIRPGLRQGIPEGNNSGVIYSSVNPKRAEVFAGNVQGRTQGYVGKVTPIQIKGNNLTEFIDNNLIGNRKDLIFNKQIDGTPQLISFGNPQQQVMNLQGFVGSSNKLPITKPLINRNTNTIRRTILNKVEPYLAGDKKIPMSGYKPKMNIIDHDMEIPPMLGESIPIVQKQKELWKLHGVNTNLSDQKIHQMILKRQNEIHKTAPNTYMVDVPKGITEEGKITLHSKINDATEDLGFIKYDKPGYSEPNHYKVEFIRNLENTVAPKTSVSKPLYQGLLNRAHSEGKEGFLSGRDLWNPEKTIKTIDDNFLSTTSDKMTGVRKFKENPQEYVRDAVDNEDELIRSEFIKDIDRYNSKGEFRPPVYGFPVKKVYASKQPMQYPIKSILSATPNTKLNWSNDNAFKSIMGIIGLSNTLTSHK